MTVKELIDELSRMDPDKEVIAGYDEWSGEPICVTVDENEDYVEIEQP